MGKAHCIAVGLRVLGLYRSQDSSVGLFTRPLSRMREIMLLVKALSEKLLGRCKFDI